MTNECHCVKVLTVEHPIVVGRKEEGRFKSPTYFRNHISPSWYHVLERSYAGRDTGAPRNRICGLRMGLGFLESGACNKHRRGDNEMFKV
jgi:hypothetical protein